MGKIKIQKKDIWIDMDLNILDTGTSISHRA